jgi:hypothetical protein
VSDWFLPGCPYWAQVIIWLVLFSVTGWAVRRGIEAAAGRRRRKGQAWR